MREQCKKCRYKYNPRAFPCTKCEDKNLSQSPVTCEDCRISWFDCAKRGKNQRKMRPCKDFEWS